MIQYVSSFRREIPNTLFVYCNNCRACVQLTLEIKGESIKECPPLTCERACSGNEIKSRIETHYIISLELVCRREHDRFWVMFLPQVRILMLLILAI